MALNHEGEGKWPSLVSNTELREPRVSRVTEKRVAQEIVVGGFVSEYACFARARQRVFRQRVEIAVAPGGRWL